MRRVLLLWVLLFQSFSHQKSTKTDMCGRIFTGSEWPRTRHLWIRRHREIYTTSCCILLALLYPIVWDWWVVFDVMFLSWIGGLPFSYYLRRKYTFLLTILIVCWYPWPCSRRVCMYVCIGQVMNVFVMSTPVPSSGRFKIAQNIQVQSVMLGFSATDVPRFNFRCETKRNNALLSVRQSHTIVHSFVCYRHSIWLTPCTNWHYGPCQFPLPSFTNSQFIITMSFICRRYTIHAIDWFILWLSISRSFI
jgi:hypothetical protein